MDRLASEVILLRAVDFGESDRIVHLLSPEVGRLTVIAKGARRSIKRFPGTLDLFNHLRVAVNRRRPGSMAMLEQATLLEPFLGLRVQSARYALASYLLELMDRMAPEGAARPDAQRLFGFVLSALRTLDGATPNARLRVLLELRAFDALGLRPELARCVRCGERPQGRVAFHVADGGVICGAHAGERSEGTLPVHVGTLKVLQQGLEYDYSRLGRLAFSPQALAEARQLLFRFQRFHVGIELRSERFLDESLGWAGLTPEST
jgi:DNA repair protein RecO (recombination protein O)